MNTEKTVAVNYTPEQTQQAVEAYQAGQSVEAIAISLGKSVRSIVAKLSREGVYVSKAKVAGTARMTKAQLVAMAEVNLGIAAGTLASLEKASYEALDALTQHIPVR